MLNEITCDAPLFREAMSRVAASVHVVTTDGPAGRHGATATSIASLTDQPPTLIVCLNCSSRAYLLVRENGVLAVNLLGAQHEALSKAFSASSGGADDGRFGVGTWRTLATGAPVLADALAAFDCRVVEERVYATHAALFVTVLAARVGPADGANLLHHQRRYRPLEG